MAVLVQCERRFRYKQRSTYEKMTLPQIIVEILSGAFPEINTRRLKFTRFWRFIFLHFMSRKEEAFYFTEMDETNMMQS